MEQTASTRRKWACHISAYNPPERAPCLSKALYWQQHKNYSTFRRKGIILSESGGFGNDQPFFTRITDRIRVFRKNQTTSSFPTTTHGNCKVAVFIVLCIAISLYHFQTQTEDYYAEPQWKWDHNVYNPRQTPTGNKTTSSSSSYQHESDTPALEVVTRHQRNLLLAQFSGSPILDTMAAISSRPNRAYARQWVRDYVRYTGSSSKRLERSCFDKVNLLSTILYRQQQAHSESIWSQPPSPQVQYDAILLLPPDAIITDLDSNLIDFLPSDKLLAMTSYEHTPATTGSTFSEIVFFNLRHELAKDVADLWASFTAPPVTCGAGNDIELLLDAVDSLVNDEHHQETVDDLVITLNESSQGFVGGSRNIKVIPQKVPSSKAAMLVSNVAEIRAELQTTADSVCYRYYPRCDVL